MIAGQTEGKVAMSMPLVGVGTRLRILTNAGKPFEVTITDEDFIKYKLPRDLVGRRVRLTLELED